MRVSGMLALVVLGCSSIETIGYLQDPSGTDSAEDTEWFDSMSTGGDSEAPPVDTNTSSGSDTAEFGTDTGEEWDSAPDTGVGTDTGGDTETLSCPYPAMFVEGSTLYDSCGAPVIPIGVNEMVVWNSADRSGADLFPEIKKSGANAARFSWSTGPPLGGTSPTLDELDRAIANCIGERMIALPEIHDYDRSDFDAVSTIVDWWTSPGVVDVIARHQRHLLVTIANGAGGDEVTADRFLTVYGEAIGRMRDAGIQVPIVIEPSGFGGDIDMLLGTFAALVDSDPLGNLMFSLHIWWASPDGSTTRIIDALQRAADIDMPLFVSEFAARSGACTQDYIDIETLMGECVRHGFGYFPWTWGGVTDGDCVYLGMTYDGGFGNWRDTPDTGRWGEQVVITSPNSIQNRTVEVSSFSSF